MTTYIAKPFFPNYAEFVRSLWSIYAKLRVDRRMVSPADRDQIRNWLGKVYAKYVVQNYTNYAEPVSSWTVSMACANTTLHLDYFDTRHVEPDINYAYWSLNDWAPRPLMPQSNKLKSWNVANPDRELLNTLNKSSNNWVLISNRCDELCDVIDWLCYNPKSMPRDVTRLGWLQAQECSKKWHDEAAKRRKKERNASLNNPGQRRPIDLGKLNTDWKVFVLTDQQALVNEGLVQHHCVANYWNDVQTGDCAILSFEQGTTRYTVELSSEYSKSTSSLPALSNVRQIRGVCNSVPDYQIKAHIQAILDDPDVRTQIASHLFPKQPSPFVKKHMDWGYPDEFFMPAARRAELLSLYNTMINPVFAEPTIVFDLTGKN